jgi:hypothetical protein
LFCYRLILCSVSVNFVVLVTACWQAYEARDIKSEFAEARYIAMTVFSLTQGFLTGLPIVAVARDTPETFYLILTILVFSVCAVVLSLIFIPKMMMQRRYGRMTKSQQNKAMLVSVRLSARMDEDGPGLGSMAFRSARNPTLQQIDESAPVESDKGAVVAKPDGRRVISSYVEESTLQQIEEAGISAPDESDEGAVVAKPDGRCVISSYVEVDENIHET